MNYKVTTLSIITVWFLSGCSAPDDIQPQNHLMTEQVIQHSQNLNQPPFFLTNWPQTNWWETFHDAQLNQFVQQAIEHSPTMQLANSRLTQANVLVAQANSQFDPTLTATANMRRARLSRQEDYSMQGNLYSTSRGLGLNASYTFDLWGGKRAAWEAAVDAQKASEIDHQAARLTLSADVVKNYIRLSNAYALLDLAKKDHARSTRIVEITQQLLDHGLTSEDRLYTAQSLDVTAAQVVKKRQLEIQQLKNALATLIGQGTDRVQTMTQPSLTVDTRLTLPEELPAALISHRPDITAARWRVEAASQDIKVAKTRFYPNFNLSAMAGFKSILGDAVFGEVSRSWNVTPAISLPIFFTQDLKANLLSKTADYDAAVAQYNQTLIQALGEVSDQILMLRSVKLQLKDALQSMSLATKSYHITEKRYEAGMGSHLEVLMAEQQLLLAESEYIGLKNQQKEVKISLIQALGGGYQAPLPSGTLSSGTSAPIEK